MGFLEVASGALGILGQRKARKQSQAGAAAADPFASQRGAYQDLLAQVFGLPTSEDRRMESAKGLNRSAIENNLAEAKRRLEGLGTGPRRNKYQANLEEGLIKQYEQQLADLDVLEAQQTDAAPKQPQGMDILKNIPGLQFAIEQGTKAATRKASALGLGRSGNLISEISRQATGLASQRGLDYIEQLGRFAGATGVSPETAGKITSQAPTSLSGVGGFLQTLGTLKG